MVHGPRAGLALLGTLDDDDRMAQNHRLEAVRGHLLELAGDAPAARDVLPAGGADDGERCPSSSTSPCELPDWPDVRASAGIAIEWVRAAANRACPAAPGLRVGRPR